jgi:hypothetical protein
MTFVPVPEASVNKNDRPKAGEYKIRTTGQLAGGAADSGTQGHVNRTAEASRASYFSL